MVGAAEPDGETPPPAGRPSRGQQAARGALWATAETWGIQLVQLAAFLAMARLLGPDVYGLVGIALTVNLVGEALIVDGGWIEAIVQRRDLDGRHLDAAFWSVLGLGICTGFVAISIAPVLAASFGQPQVAPLMAALGLALPLRSLSIVPEGLLCRRLDFAPLAARSLLSVALASAGGVTLALGGAGVWSLVVYHLMQPLVAAVLVWRSVDYRPATALSRPHLRSFLPFVGTMLADRAVVAGDSVLPRLVIGYLIGPGALGHYTVARKLMELATQLLTRPIMRAGLSSFAASADRPETVRVQFGWSVVLGMAVALPVFIGLALVAPDIVTLTLGAGWTATGFVLRILALAGPAWALSRICAVLLYSHGRPAFQLAANAAALLLLALLLLVSGASVTAPVIAALIVARSYLVLPLQLLLVRRATGINPLPALAGTWHVVAGSAAMLAAIFLFRSSLPMEVGAMPMLLGSAAIGAGAYAATLALLVRPLLREVATAIGMVRLAPTSSGRDSSGGEVA